MSVRSAAIATLLIVPWGGSCAPATGSTAALPRATYANVGEGEPQEEPSGVVELTVPGFESAVVSLPRRRNGKNPLLVAAHGAWDRPEPHCDLWRRVTSARGFILCPRGKSTNRHTSPDRAAYYYPDHLALAREALAAIEALSARFPDELDPSAAVWAGFSQGAIHGALVIALYPKRFPRAVLVEGGNGFFDEWSPFAARKYARGGGERVLFSCGSLYCVRSAEGCAGYLKAAHVQALVTHAEGAGHSYGPLMEHRLREHFDWLVTGDARWTNERGR